jgi:hypothetical protein
VRGPVALALVLVAGCATGQSELRDGRFAVVNHGSFTPDEVQRVRAQLEAGARALERYIGPIPAGKFPVGSGTHGRGG